MSTGQASDRHAQERPKEYYVGEEREVKNMSRKPTNAGQLEKQN